jgi:hypothetical protein
MARDFRTLKLEILAETKQFVQGMNESEKKTESFGEKLGDFGKKAGLALAAATAAVGAFAIKVAVDGVKAASDLSETVSKVGVLFGDSASKVEEFAATAATSLGQTKQQALDAASTFAIFGKSAGLAGDDLVKFSTDFVGLASDLASFNNTSPEDAIQAIGAALRGETEPLRRYGVLLDDASLRQAALGLGIIKTTKEALTPQQKVLAAQELIYKQTSAAQGDFERTSDGLANSQRILTAQIQNIQTEIGTALLPIVLKMTTIFSQEFLPVIQSIANAFTGKAGGLSEGIFDVVNVIKSYLIPIIDGAKNAFGDIKGAITENIDEFRNFFDVVKSLAPIIGSTIGAALNVVGDIAAIVINVVSNVLGVVSSLINKAIAAINFLIKGANKIPGVSIPLIGVGGGGADGGYQTGANTSSIANAISNAAGSSATGSSAAGSSAAGSTGGRSGSGNDSFDSLMKKLKSDTDKAKKKLDDEIRKSFNLENSLILNAANIMANDPDVLRANALAEMSFQARLQDDPERDKALAERARLQGTTNIYISGTVIDPEGLNRVLTDIQSQSDSRGTLSLAEIRARAG